MNKYLDMNVNTQQLCPPFKNKTKNDTRKKGGLKGKPEAQSSSLFTRPPLTTTQNMSAITSRSKATRGQERTNPTDHGETECDLTEDDTSYEGGFGALAIDKQDANERGRSESIVEDENYMPPAEKLEDGKMEKAMPQDNGSKTLKTNHHKKKVETDLGKSNQSNLLETYIENKITSIIQTGFKNKDKLHTLNLEENRLIHTLARNLFHHCMLSLKTNDKDLTNELKTLTVPQMIKVTESTGRTDEALTKISNLLKFASSKIVNLATEIKMEEPNEKLIDTKHSITTLSRTVSFIAREQKHSQSLSTHTEAILKRQKHEWNANRHLIAKVADLATQMASLQQQANQTSDMVTASADALTGLERMLIALTQKMEAASNDTYQIRTELSNHLAIVTKAAVN